MYWAYLQRAPDTPGLNWWVGQLNSGATQEQVRAAFATSGEFEGKVANICPSVNVGGLKYILSDHQGSARMITNNTGAMVSRHDYAPYGEELWAGVGMRTTAQGFGATDTVRQRYGLTERDEATGLEHTWWRKYDNTAGRWTSPDPYKGSFAANDPQSLNRYAYVSNDPVNLIDPSGLYQICIYSGEVITYHYPGGRTVTVVKANPTVCFEIGGRQSGQGNRLTGGQFEKKVQEVYDRVAPGGKKFSPECWEFLRKAGFTTDQIIKAILTLTPYDGPASSNITTTQAGILPSGYAESNQSVSDFFAQNKGYDALATPYGNGNDAYFRPDKVRPSYILHEALHNLTAKLDGASKAIDIPLAAKLGLGTFANTEKGARDASRAITKALKKKGCA